MYTTGGVALTDEGLEYVRERLAQGRTPVTQQWREYYGI